MLSKICNLVTAIMIAILLLLAAVLAGPKLFGWSTLSVLTGSMEPNLPVGSLVIVNHNVTVSDLAPGDIITFTFGGDTLATHRLLDIEHENERLITKGDANPTVDGGVAYDRLVGKVEFNIPKLGQLAASLSSKKAIPMISGYVMVMILAIFLPEVFKKEETPKTSTKYVRDRRLLNRTMNNY